ncbi:MAG: membrane protein insertase YidC [Chloroflexi bacterium]|nr:membrane protein insertase YidC [Chloroflexota bacterium]
MDIGAIWDLIILSPMINVLIVLSGYLLNNFGLAILVLTILVRLVTLPLTLKQLKATKAMQDMQPLMEELKRKHPRDKQKLAQEQMRLYKESGVSPAGCLLPMLVQMPIWIALFQSIIRVLAVVPEDFLSLSRYLYTSWEQVFSLVPLNSQFLWLDLAVPDKFILLPILVGGTMWVQQKMIMPSRSDSKQAAQQQMMLWMMPLMFAFLTMQFPSGLALYWVISNAVTIVIQYYITGGWGGLATVFGKKPARDKKYHKRIAYAEEKRIAVTDADADADADAGTDLGADISAGGKVSKKGSGFQMINRQAKKGRSHRRKR